MKRLVALLLGALGLRALLQRRRESVAVDPAPQAEELRVKLAQARASVEQVPAEPAAVEEPVATQAADPVPAEDPAPELSSDRRADVHAEARRRIDELRDRGEQV